MRQGYALLAGLMIGLGAGCTSPNASAPGWWDRLRPFQGPTGPDVVRMDVALLELPAGDSYLRHELWTAADEQAVALERKSVLEANGLRVGQIGGITPARLQALLMSEKSYSTTPRNVQLRAGNTRTLEIGPERARCQFLLHQDRTALPVDLEKAGCTFQVQPSLTQDGRTRLLFTPIIRHGEAKLTLLPSADRSRLEVLNQPSTETYSALSWEVTLAPNEYVVIGARADRPHTLGHRYFVREDEPVAVQRLLVIRTNRPAPTEAPSADEDEPAVKRSPSLAAQAAWSGGPGRKP